MSGGGARAQGRRRRDPRGAPGPALTCGCLLGSIKQLHERVTQECAEYRALYEKMVLPPNMGPRVDWARVLEQKQVRVIPGAGDSSRSWKSHPAVLRAILCHQGPDSTLGPGGG